MSDKKKQKTDNQESDVSVRFAVEDIEVAREVYIDLINSISSVVLKYKLSPFALCQMLAVICISLLDMHFEDVMDRKIREVVGFGAGMGG